MRQLKKLGVVLMSSWILVGCAGISIKDIEGCGDLGPVGARCNYLFSDAPRDLNKLEWDKLREGWICFDAASFGELKKAILKLCERHGCTIEEREKIEKGFEKVDNILNPKPIPMPWPPV